MPRQKRSLNVREYNRYAWDRQVDYGQVVQAMTLLQAAGAPSVGLLTEPPR